MDFAALMSKEISKARQPPPPTGGGGEKKYLKRSEVEAGREAAYIASQKALQAEREEKAAQKRKREEEEAAKNEEREAKRKRLAEESRRRREEEEVKRERARRKRLGLPDLPPKDAVNTDSESATDNAVDDVEDIPDEEITSRLRALDEPARLFGESHKGRLRRLHRLTAPSEPSSGNPTKTQGPIPTTLSPVPEAEMLLPAALPPATDTAAWSLIHRKLASWLNLVLSEWSIALSTRPDAVKHSFAGRSASTAYTQSLLSLPPLFRLLETHTLPPTLLNPLCGIVLAAQERRYVDANDGYLTLSIGKAAWPIGVTMVGIHERSAREKLHESGEKGGHIMSDEGTRRWLQSLKRCLSFAQTRWPPEDGGQLMG